ncbi:hypothetical protein DWW82_06250 [Clostridium sp. AF17-2]|nr:hypothetical protein DWW85_06305 [Clostridium sp. AF17-21AC]RHR58586.1 hypothetical protein DWW82_06250 [Clostridium sp. AF17-2]
MPVNTGACLSRRRVSTGVFTNQACATNRNRSKPYYSREANCPCQPPIPAKETDRGGQADCDFSQFQACKNNSFYV